MEQFAEYQGPNADDYGNVRALNMAFLRATTDLKEPETGRLADTPFLLFSLREQDLSWWDRALAVYRQDDLVEEVLPAEPSICQLQVAALSFLWYLGRRNPYAARVLTGASVAWCELVAELPLVTLLDSAGGRSELLRSRLNQPCAMSEQLQGGATSSRRAVQRSSQHTALQLLLTRNHSQEEYKPLAAAACRMAGEARVINKKV